MRKILGYVRNLTDGQGAPDGTVLVHAEPTADNKELDLEDHGLGNLRVIHQAVGGSGSATIADSEGRFGWEMDLSPGPILVKVNPTDPSPGEQRRRFADESAQIGKGFQSDVERLGWAAGKDCLIWDAIEGGHRPAAGQWDWDPHKTGVYGNWSVASYGSGADAGRVTIRKGIAFLGGVLFSVEMDDLKLPLPNDAVLPSNSGSQPRWDLLSLKMITDPTSTTYGKQSFVFQRGNSDNTIPVADASPSGSRMLPLFALKMDAGANVYSGTYDLRPWSTPPLGGGVSTPAITTKAWYWSSFQEVGDGWLPSMLNTGFGTDELIVPPGSAYAGIVLVTAAFTPALGSNGGVLAMEMAMRGRSIQGGPEVPNSNYIAYPVPGYFGTGITSGNGSNTDVDMVSTTTTAHMVNRIPSTAEGRTWHRARFALYLRAQANMVIHHITAQANLWTVP